MKALVTGCAGFIGSHLTERLLADGWEVAGVDCLTDYYDPKRKARNLAGFRDRPGFTFYQEDLAAADLKPRVEHPDVIFHLAGQPGVRASWGKSFDAYASANIMATQRLLEAVRDLKTLDKFVFASSSSVYGDTTVEKVNEDHPTRPLSPYGVTKLAAEHLCALYAANFGVRAVALRFFTVYGPRQRPDMSFAKLIAAALAGEPFEMYGDGTQERGFTFVEDIVAGLLATAVPAAQGVYNLGGGTVTSMKEVVKLVEHATGRALVVRNRAKAPGDVQRTSADIARAAAELGWAPVVPLAEGIARQVAWARAG